MARFIHDRDTLLSFLGSITPIQECQFYVKIEPQRLVPYVYSADDALNTDNVGVEASEESVVATEFSIPDAGVKYAIDASLMGITVPQITFNSFSLGFLVKSDLLSLLKSPIHTYYEGMFKGGLLREGFNKPTVSMWVKLPSSVDGVRSAMGKVVSSANTAAGYHALSKDIDRMFDLLTTPVCLFEAKKCKFSQPIPTMNQKSTEFSVFRTQVSYSEFNYGGV